MGELFLKLEGARKRYGGVVALDAVDFRVYSGEVQCLAGGNGSGKSTLIKIISGVERPDPGTALWVRGQGRRHWTAAMAVREGIEVMYQDLSLFPNLTVGENIVLAGWVRDRRFWTLGRQGRDMAKETLRRVGVDLDLQARVSDLSVAEQQLVALARALTARPRLLIMDEPTTALTRREIDALFGVVRGLVREGIAVLLVSHKLDEVLEIAARVTVLRDGRKLGEYDAAGLDADQLGSMIAGGSLEREKNLHGGVRRGEPILELRGLSRRGQFEGITFQVRRGEVVGLTGLLGSGRTELALSLFGLNPSDAGEIRVGGQCVRIQSVREAMELGIAYVPEDRSVQGLVMDHAIGWNLTLPSLCELTGCCGWLSSKRESMWVDAALSQWGIRTTGPEMAVSTLSGGNQQRVVVGKWLGTRPRLLLLDSPTVGIDVGAKRELHRMIREQASGGMGVLLITDELPEVLAATDRFYVMKGGRMVGEYESGSTSASALRAMLEEAGE
jgi:simple sugar transport system ATP-binding protein